MERFELEDSLKEEIRARTLGEGFVKIVQTVRRNGETFRISIRPVEIGGRPGKLRRQLAVTSSAQALELL